MTAPVSVSDDSADSGLAVVTVDSPPLNLFDDAMGTSLAAAVDELEGRRPRAVLVRFEGRLVTGGVDIGLFEGLDAAAGADFMASLVAISRRVAALPCPTVFAAHERCLTWGFELALACDLILAAEPARFGLIEATVGLTPAMGGTQRIAERAGIGRARQIVMTGELFDAAMLQAWGVVDRVLPADGFDDAARAFARRLADGPTLAHAGTKAVLHAWSTGGVEQADVDLPGIAGALFETGDLRGALATFRKEGPGNATFRGR